MLSINWRHYTSSSVLYGVYIRAFLGHSFAGNLIGTSVGNNSRLSDIVRPKSCNVRLSLQYAPTWCASFGLESRAVFNWVSKVILQLLWFNIAAPCDWRKTLASLFRPILSKTKTDRDLLALVFLLLAPASCICFAFWLVHWIVFLCPWLPQ